MPGDTELAQHRPHRSVEEARVQKQNHPGIKGAARNKGLEIAVKIFSTEPKP
jgi:hypothetical protein